MGALATRFEPLTDPRCRTDAYILLGAHLYEVVCWEAQAMNSGKLHVINSLTEHPMWLTGSEVQRAKLIRAAPALEMPPDWAPSVPPVDLGPSENTD